jgi:hypothetical protein
MPLLFFQEKIFSITIPCSRKYTSCTFLSYSRNTVFIKDFWQREDEIHGRYYRCGEKSRYWRGSFNIPLEVRMREGGMQQFLPIKRLEIRDRITGYYGEEDEWIPRPFGSGKIDRMIVPYYAEMKVCR